MSAIQSKIFDFTAAIKQVAPSEELLPNTQLLGGAYTIVSFLNSGGFGISYLAKDTQNRAVVIKECYPASLCDRDAGIVQPRSSATIEAFAKIKADFISRAQAQAELSNENVAKVQRVFEQNGTAYMALDFIDGADLSELIAGHEAPNAADVQSWLRDALAGLATAHAKGMLHRDISPDNILIDQNNRAVLIDFGGNRVEENKRSRAMSELRVVNDGYSPQEAYIAGIAENASCDLFALAATFYHLISGEKPVESQVRLASIAQNQKDIYNPLAGRIEGYPEEVLASIDKALNILNGERFACAQDWTNMLDGKPATSSNVISVCFAAIKSNAAGILDTLRNRAA